MTALEKKSGRSDHHDRPAVYGYLHAILVVSNPTAFGYRNPSKPRSTPFVQLSTQLETQLRCLVSHQLLSHRRNPCTTESTHFSRKCSVSLWYIVVFLCLFCLLSYQTSQLTCSTDNSSDRSSFSSSTIKSKPAVCLILKISPLPLHKQHQEERAPALHSSSP